MSEYVPRTADVRECYASSGDGLDFRLRLFERYAEFDRWLAEVQREAAEKAWDRCHDDTHEWYRTVHKTLYTAPENPYRKDEE